MTLGKYCQLKTLNHNWSVPRLVPMLLPSTQKRSIARNCWNPA